jgi:hypothetical protein
MKRRQAIQQPPLFKNSELRKAVCKIRSYTICSSQLYLIKTGNKYKRTKNSVAKFKKVSIENYFFERCAEGPKFSSFWPTMRTSLSNIGNIHNKDIILEENNKIINDQTEV